MSAPAAAPGLATPWSAAESRALRLSPVVRKIARTRQVWVADDGSILKTHFTQSQPESFTVDVLFGEGVVYVNKNGNGVIGS